MIDQIRHDLKNMHLGKSPLLSHVRASRSHANTIVEEVSAWCVIASTTSNYRGFVPTA